MKPMDMAEALFGSDDDAIGKPEGSVDTSAMAAIAAHLAREDAGPAPATAPAAASAGRDEVETRAGGISIDPYCNYGRPGTRWEEVAWTRLSQHDLYPEKVDNR